jgi:hypothetical protein
VSLVSLVSLVSAGRANTYFWIDRASSIGGY